MKPDPYGYAIDRDNVARYFYWTQILIALLLTLWMFGLGAVLYAYTLGQWLPGRQAGALKYWLDGTTLRVDTGVYFLSRRAIPLDRVTDIVLSQGPLMRRFGIWSIRVQATGPIGQAIMPVVLFGVRDPEEVRDELLAARDMASRRAVV
jgi:putative membrane protein